MFGISFTIHLATPWQLPLASFGSRIWLLKIMKTVSSQWVLRVSLSTRHSPKIHRWTISSFFWRARLWSYRKRYFYRHSHKQRRSNQEHYHSWNYIYHFLQDHVAWHKTYQKHSKYKFIYFIFIIFFHLNTPLLQ